MVNNGGEFTPALYLLGDPGPCSFLILDFLNYEMGMMILQIAVGRWLWEAYLSQDKGTGTRVPKSEAGQMKPGSKGKTLPLRPRV